VGKINLLGGYFMSYQDTQALKTNMFTIFLPIFLAIALAVPIAAFVSFAITRSDHAYAANDQNANTSITAAAPMCVVPAHSHADSDSEPTVGGYGAGFVYGHMMPALQSGNISQTTTENTYTYYDSFNTGSYNNTQSWEDNDTNTQSWEDNDSSTNTQSWTDDHSNTGSFNNDNSNQGNPVNTVTTTTVNDNSNQGNNSSTNSNTQSWEDNDSNTQSWTDSSTTVNDNSNTQSIGDVTVLLPVLLPVLP